MSIQTKIQDGTGSGSLVRVNEYGLLASGPLGFSEASNAICTSTNTAYTLVSPRANHQFIVTSILLYANKGVGTNDATVELYEASEEDTITVSKSILQTELPKKVYRDLTNLNLIITGSKWLNIKTDDATVYATIFGYYVPVT